LGDRGATDLLRKRQQDAHYEIWSPYDAFGAAAAKVQAENVAKPARCTRVTCSFRETQGFLAGTIAHAARLSDLVVFGPISGKDTQDVNECFVDVLTKIDQPVLISAKIPTKLTGKVALAWDGGAAACHAIIGTMPFIEKAESLTILRVGSEHKRDDADTWYSNRTSIHELEDYLALNGVTGKEQIVERGAKSTGEALLDAALSSGADLLIMGGYGHSHLRETIFGGVTSHVRWHAELPVLMVH